MAEYEECCEKSSGEEEGGVVVELCTRVDSYPESFGIMKESFDYQCKFR